MKLFNTMTRKKEEFKPINSGIVNMYVCGPTVYDLFHIGNARTFIFFDVVRRYMEYTGYEVNFIQNFTDIDDKIIAKAGNESKNIREISEEYISCYYDDADKLNIKRATFNPKATDNIDEMVNLIMKLLDNGNAYEVEGNVYFSVSSFDEYGKLFGQDLKTLRAGSRVEVNESKKDPLDFILWKKSKSGEPCYSSPWGKGRPGWHTECCSMIHKYFNGGTIDIHGGGIDLVFPHHENELAQIESLRKTPISNYWMHCGFLSINREKMSKSLKNFLTTRDVLNKYSSNVVRFFMLSSHYRVELNFSEEQLIWAEKSLERIFNCYFWILDTKSVSGVGSHNIHLSEISKFKEKFLEKMDDDFNTSDAISVIFELVKYVNIHKKDFNHEVLIGCRKIIEDFFNVMGINQNLICYQSGKKLGQRLKEMICQRNELKKNRQFESADFIRESLLKEGIVLQDIKGGVRVLDLNTNEMIETIFY